MNPVDNFFIMPMSELGDQETAAELRKVAESGDVPSRVAELMLWAADRLSALDAMVTELGEQE